MKNLFFLFSIVFSVYSTAQIQTISSQKTFGTLFDEVAFIPKVYNGFIYTFITPASAGISQDKTVAGFNQYDGWFVKMDLNFNVLDQFVFGGTFGDIAADFVEMDNGDFILLLTSGSDISGNKTEAQIGSSDYWVIRINSTGNILWQKVYGGTADDEASHLVKISNSKVIVVGTSLSSISGNKTVSSNGIRDIWTVTIDGSGTILDQKSFGGASSEFITTADYNANNNTIIYSCWSGSGVSGNKTIPLVGIFDAWIFTTDENGVILNQNGFGTSTTAFTTPGAVATDQNGNVFLFLGSNFNGVVGDKTVAGYGNEDAWLIKMDGALNEISQFAYGGSEDDGAQKTYFDGENIIVSGVSKSGISGIKNEVNFGDFDNWIFCIDTDGVLLWQKTIGGDQGENCRLFHEENNNEYFVMANSASGISGNKTVPLHAPGQTDLWLYKLSTTLSITKNEGSEIFHIGPNPFEEKISFSWNSVIQNVQLTIFNSNGKIVDRITEMNGNVIEWSASSLASGIYFYEITSDDGMSQGKIVKK